MFIEWSWSFGCFHILLAQVEDVAGDINIPIPQYMAGCTPPYEVAVIRTSCEFFPWIEFTAWITHPHCSLTRRTHLRGIPLTYQDHMRLVHLDQTLVDPPRTR